MTRGLKKKGLSDWLTDNQSRWNGRPTNVNISRRVLLNTLRYKKITSLKNTDLTMNEDPVYGCRYQ